MRSSRQETCYFGDYASWIRIRENSGELVSEREPIMMCPTIRIRSATAGSPKERWQSGRMRIIANDVTLSKGSQGSNPCLSVQSPQKTAGFFFATKTPRSLKFLFSHHPDRSRSLKRSANRNIAAALVERPFHAVEIIGRRPKQAVLTGRFASAARLSPPDFRLATRYPNLLLL